MANSSRCWTRSSPCARWRKWTEIVYLVVPTLNDSDAEFRGLARWVKTDLGLDVPLHFTQFHPRVSAEEPAPHAR